MLIKHFLRVPVIIALGVLQTACIGTAIEATTDAAIAVGKIPFKVGGAVVDVATGDDDKEDAKEDKR